MDEGLQTLSDILHQDEPCLECPNCHAFNPIESLLKHYMNGRKERHFYSMQMFKTVVCLCCKYEWLQDPQIEE